MIKLIFKLCLLALLGGLLSSCGNDTDEELDIALISGSGLVSGPRSVTDGQPLAARVTARANNGTTLTRFRIRLQYHNQPDELIYLDSTITGSRFTYTHPFSPRQVNGSERYIFEVTNSNGQTSTTGFLINTQRQSTSPDFSTYSVRLWNPADSISHSFLALNQAAVYNQVPVRQEAFQNSIDLVHFFTDQDSAALASPSESAAFDNAPNLDFTDWAVKNKTELKPVDEDVYTNATNGTLVQNAFPSATASPVAAVTQLKANQAFAFRTSAGKQGVFRVREVQSSASQKSITLDIKVGN